MTSSEPILGYQIGRRLEQSEIPASIPVRAKDAVGFLGIDGVQLVVAPGIDVLELGILWNAGRFFLIPVDADHNLIWAQSLDLLVSEEQAAAQRAIRERFYRALLALLPHDADDLHAGVTTSIERDQWHPVVELLCRAAAETWALERRPVEPLTDAERQRLTDAAARRAVALLGAQVPRCRLDRESLAPIVQRYRMACSWDRILYSVADGDHEDATARLVARLQLRRAVNMPMSCLLQVLPGVQRLDIFFLALRHTTEPLRPPLLRWVEREPLGADPAAAELAVRVLYTLWRATQDTAEAKSIMRAHLHRIQATPRSDDAQLIQVYLATALKIRRGVYRVPEVDLPLFHRVEAALERWDRALRTTIDEVIVSLPARVVDAPAGA